MINSSKMIQKYFTLFLLFSNFLGWTQQTDSLNKSVLTKGTLDKQFDYVIKNSNNFQEYKVVKKEYLTHLKKGNADSISKYKVSIIKLTDELQKNENYSNGLEKEKIQLEANIKEITEDKDQILFLGVSMSKASYNVLVFSIIGILLILLIASVYQMRSAIVTSKNSRSSLAILEEEFEEYKKRSMEKEQLLGRKLQDEIIKQSKSKK
jgi:hypothetical protein